MSGEVSEFSIGIERSPTSTGWFLGAGEIRLGDYRPDELVEASAVTIKLDRGEAEDLFSFLRKELGR